MNEGVPGMSGHTLREEYVRQACEVLYSALGGRPFEDLPDDEQQAELAAMDTLIAWMDSRRIHG